MGSSQGFDEEKSFNGFNNDSLDISLNQDEYLENEINNYINLGFMNPGSHEIPNNSQENSDISSRENKEEDNLSSNTNSTRNRRGRRTNNLNIQHPLTKNDCRMAKIQTGYFTFLIIFINTVMKKLKLKYFFLQLEGKFKRNINQNFRKFLNKKTIRDILYNEPISEKYKKYDKFENKKIIDRLENEKQKIILDILDKNFLYFFENLFYLNIKKFNLSTLGFEPLEIVLDQNVKMFNNLMKESRCKDFIIYKNKMEKCAKKYFISSNLYNPIDEIDI